MTNSFYANCFVKKFQITSKIKCLPRGVVYNVIKPGGWIIIGLFVIQCSILRQYYGWAKKAVNMSLAHNMQI